MIFTSVPRCIMVKTERIRISQRIKGNFEVEGDGGIDHDGELTQVRIPGHTGIDLHRHYVGIVHNLGYPGRGFPNC
jgi:hypothetical protein